MTDKETIKVIFEILKKTKEQENFLSPVESEILQLIEKNLED
jgi:hypothetical protein